MSNLIKIDENIYENMLNNNRELKYTLTIPEEYIDEELCFSLTLNGEEIYKQLIKKDNDVRFV